MNLHDAAWEAQSLARLAESEGAGACDFSFRDTLVSVDSKANERRFEAFGTINLIHVEASPEKLDACEALCLSLHQNFNRFDETSELSRLNAHAGQDFQCSQDMAALLQVACALYGESDGSYNVAVGPLSDLWHFESRDDQAFCLPDSAAVEDAMRRIDLSQIELKQSRAESAAYLSSVASDFKLGQTEQMRSRSEISEKATSVVEGTTILEMRSYSETSENSPTHGEDTALVRIPSGMQLDLGSIVKGYAADRTAAFLWAQGVRSGFLNFGGTILVLGPKSDGSPWSFGLQESTALPGQDHWAALDLHWGAVAVSAGYERGANREGRRFHHLIDPKTGHPSDKGVAETVVIAQNAMMADALSTAAFVMGPENAFDLVHDLNAAVLFRMDDGHVLMTEGFPVRH